MKFILYNKNGYGQGCGLLIGVIVGVVIIVPETSSKKLRPIIIIVVIQS